MTGGLPFPPDIRNKIYKECSWQSLANLSRVDKQSNQECYQLFRDKFGAVQEEKIVERRKNRQTNSPQQISRFPSQGRMNLLNGLRSTNYALNSFLYRNR